MSEYITITTPDGRDVRLPKGMSRQEMAAALNQLPPANNQSQGMNHDLLLEAERRGILPPERQMLLDEARRRGLAGGDQQVEVKGVSDFALQFVMEGQESAQTSQLQLGYRELMDKSRELLAQGRREDARRVAQIALKRREQANEPASGLDQTLANINQGPVGQFVGGVNDGALRLLGLPMDVSRGAGNLALIAIDAVAGTNLRERKREFDESNPLGSIGGSGSIANAARELGITGVEPQTSTQRFARGMGQDFGAGLPMASAALPVAGGKVLAAELLASGGGQGARQGAEVLSAPAWVQDTAQLAGNVLGGGLMAMPSKSRAPSFEEVTEEA